MAGNSTSGLVSQGDMHPGMLKFVDQHIPNASVLLLNSTPYTLVAAPAVHDDLLMFLGARFSLIFGSAAFQSLHDITVRYTNGSGQICGTLTGSSFFNATASTVREMYPTPSVTFKPVLNAALVLYQATGNMTTGDSTLIVRTYYRQMKAGY